MSTIVFDSVNIDEITLADPKPSRHASSCKTAYIQYRGQKLRIQTPVLLSAFDLKIKQMDPNSNASCNAALSFATEDSDPDAKAFREFLVKFDERIKKLASEKMSILGKKVDPKNIDSNYKESVKVSDKYPATFSPKVWLSLKDPENGSMKNIEHVSMEMKVFNMETEPISYEEVKRNCPTALIVTPSYLWCSTIGVGVTWHATECIVKPNEEESFGFKMGASFDKFKRKPEDVHGENKKPKYEYENEVEELQDETLDF